MKFTEGPDVGMNESTEAIQVGDKITFANHAGLVFGVFTALKPYSPQSVAHHLSKAKGRPIGAEDLCEYLVQNGYLEMITKPN